MTLVMGPTDQATDVDAAVVDVTEWRSFEFADLIGVADFLARSMHEHRADELDSAWQLLDWVGHDAAALRAAASTIVDDRERRGRIRTAALRRLAR